VLRYWQIKGGEDKQTEQYKGDWVAGCQQQVSTCTLLSAYHLTVDGCWWRCGRVLELQGLGGGDEPRAEDGRQNEDAGPGVVEGTGAALVVVVLVSLVGDEGHAEGSEDDQDHGAEGGVAVVGPEGEVHERADGGCHVGDHDGDRTGRVDGEQVGAVDDQEVHDDHDAKRTDEDVLGVVAEDDFHGLLP
jgi:hypothetical protein